MERIFLKSGIAFLVMLQFSAISARSSEESTSSLSTVQTSYLPYWGHRAEGFSHWPPGSIGGRFHWACSSPDLESATVRWAAFLDQYGAEDGGFADMFQYRCAIRAKQELMRIYYLQGQTEKADQILREFDPEKGMHSSPK